MSVKLGRTHTQTAPGPARDARSRARWSVEASAVLAGFVIAALWSYEFVDDVIGHGVARALLQEDSASAGGAVGTLLVAAVTGLAGTFTACNVACFASLGPLAAQAAGRSPSRSVLVAGASRQLLHLAAGMVVVAGLYGGAVALVGSRAPMLSAATAGPYPVTLLQASIVNVGFGVALAVVAVRFLQGSAGPGAPRTVVLGALLGLLVVGRPFPMFRELLGDAAEAGVLAAVALMALVALGNLLVVGLLFLGAVAAAGPGIQRLFARHPDRMYRSSGWVLLTLAVFSIVYWGLRVPAFFGIGWFPPSPW